MNLNSENEIELPKYLNYLRVDWDFIRINELQVRNGMQQEPGQTLTGDIYLQFLSVHKYVLNVYSVPDTGAMKTGKS